jgi:hypothetical protein
LFGILVEAGQSSQGSRIKVLHQTEIEYNNFAVIITQTGFQACFELVGVAHINVGFLDFQYQIVVFAASFYHCISKISLPGYGQRLPNQLFKRGIRVVLQYLFYGMFRLLYIETKILVQCQDSIHFFLPD